MSESQTYLVEEKARGQRLDLFLQSHLDQKSRSYLQKLITDGNVLVNKVPSKSSYRVKTNDSVTVTIPPPRLLESKPEAIGLDILFEDEDLVVVNKAAGMVVHPAAGNYEHTLVNALLHHCKGKLAGIGGVLRPGIIHRLDKGTSGCLVVAKTDLSHQALISQFKTRTVKKIYRSLCWGKLGQLSGTIETVIGRSQHDRKKMSVHTTCGRHALTEYRVLKQFPNYTYMELTLHTGRTHQIRVHLAHIGHPILGDRLYGRKQKQEIHIERTMLHAYKLGFVHPRLNNYLEVTAPMPKEFLSYTDTNLETINRIYNRVER